MNMHTRRTYQLTHWSNRVDFHHNTVISLCVMVLRNERRGVEGVGGKCGGAYRISTVNVQAYSRRRSWHVECTRYWTTTKRTFKHSSHNPLLHRAELYIVDNRTSTSPHPAWTQNINSSLFSILSEFEGKGTTEQPLTNAQSSSFVLADIPGSRQGLGGGGADRWLLGNDVIWRQQRPVLFLATGYTSVESAASLRL